MNKPKNKNEFTLVKKLQEHVYRILLLSDGRLSSQHDLTIKIHNKDDLDKIDISIKSERQIAELQRRQEETASQACFVPLSIGRIQSGNSVFRIRDQDNQGATETIIKSVLKPLES